MIDFRCDKCSAAMCGPAERIGHVEACPNCGAAVIVPAPAPEESAPPTGDSSGDDMNWPQIGVAAACVLAAMVLFIACALCRIEAGAWRVEGRWADPGLKDLLLYQTNRIAAAIYCTGGLVMSAMAVVAGRLFSRRPER